MVKEKNKYFEKEEKLRKLINKIPITVLKEITEDKPDMEKIPMKYHQVLLDCSFVETEKEEPTEKELKSALGSVLVLCTLEFFRRKGFMYINKKGFYDKTKEGRIAYKEYMKTGKKL